MKLTGKHIAILGAGRSGRAAAMLALREGATVSVWDAAGSDVFNGMPAGVEVHAGANEVPGHDFHADMLVVSPGIDTYGAYVAAFAKHAGELIGEVELAGRFYDGKIVGVTGTNGKTTTTELVARILAHAGMGGVACGNYGVPFAEVVMSGGSKAAVALELSSFQLETIRDLHPTVAIWLNFAPDHMDRYPTVEDYRNAKLRIFNNLGADNVAVVRAGEQLPETAAKVLYFSTTDSTADWFSDGHGIYCAGELVMRMDQETQLRGLHNAENVMAAMAAGRALGIPLATIREALQGYAPPRHRCELVGELDGVEYLNDSKATNIHALESALRSQTRPVVLIAGGKDKGLDYSGLIPLLSEKALCAITFGQIAHALYDVFKQAVPTKEATSLKQAVALARDHAPSGSVVLFSPGTSSFDQFSGYEERGNVFRDAVQQLN